jgi:hypothetical protein
MLAESRSLRRKLVRHPVDAGSNIVLPDGVRFTAKPWSGKDVLKLARAAVAEQ